MHGHTTYSLHNVHSRVPGVCVSEPVLRCVRQADDDRLRQATAAASATTERLCVMCCAREENVSGARMCSWTVHGGERVHDSGDRGSSVEGVFLAEHGRGTCVVVYSRYDSHPFSRPIPDSLNPPCPAHRAVNTEHHCGQVPKVEHGFRLMKMCNEMHILYARHWLQARVDRFHGKGGEASPTERMGRCGDARSPKEC